MKGLVGLSGLAGAGKDAAADILVRDHGFVKVSLADPMKRICTDVFGWGEERLWGPSEKRNEPDPKFAGLSARKALQLLGTEWGRHCYQDMWVRLAILTANSLLDPKSGARYFRDTGLEFRPQDWAGSPAPKGVVIPDVRFNNECDAIEKAGGVVWRIIRPGAGLEGAAGAHVSETELTDDMFPIENLVANTGTLADLAATVAYHLGVLDRGAAQ
jgi:hypothetical protein